MTTRKLLIPVLAALTWAFLATFAPRDAVADGTIITPSSVTFAAGYYNPPIRMIDGSGLSGVGPVLSQTHAGGHVDGPDGADFKTTRSLVFATPIDFDLGGTFDLTQVHIWNYSHAVFLFYNDRDVRDIDISLSTDGITFTLFGTITLTKGTGLTEAVQTRTLTGTASHVRFQIKNSYGPPNEHEAGLGEVRFSGTAQPTNHPPVANAGSDQTVECTSPAGASVTLNGTGSSDPDGDILTYAWSAPGITFDDPTSATPTATFPMGPTTVTLTVDDGNGGTDSDQVLVTVVDTTPPTITSVSTTPGSLWPPNHTLVPVTVNATVSDLCDGTVTSQILGVTSNEPDDGLGDGDTANDIQNIDGMSVQLRAERSGKGAGRVYTITGVSTDDAGNTTTWTVTVTVPKSQGKSKAIPGVASLRANTPNPFNPTTRIAYDLPQPAHVVLVVYNLLGQEVVRLVDAQQAPGQYEVTWDGRDTRGVSVASGIYLYRLTTSTGFVQTRRMTLLK